MSLIHKWFSYKEETPCYARKQVTVQPGIRFFLLFGFFFSLSTCFGKKQWDKIYYFWKKNYSCIYLFEQHTERRRDKERNFDQLFHSTNCYSGQRSALPEWRAMSSTLVSHKGQSPNMSVWACSRTLAASWIWNCWIPCQHSSIGSWWTSREWLAASWHKIQDEAFQTSVYVLSLSEQDPFPTLGKSPFRSFIHSEVLWAGLSASEQLIANTPTQNIVCDYVIEHESESMRFSEEV